MDLKNVRFEKKAWVDLTEEEKTDCLNLTEKHGAMREYAKDNAPVCFVARCGGVIVGWAIFDVTTRFHMLYVHPKMRKVGIATCLSRMVHTYAVSVGIEKIVIFCASYNRDYFRKAIGFGNVEMGETDQIADYIFRSYCSDYARPRDLEPWFHCKITGETIKNANHEKHWMDFSDAVIE